MLNKSHLDKPSGALGAVGTKDSPVDADKALYRDSASSDALVTSTWAQIKAFLKTYFDTLYNLYVHPNHSGDVTSVGDGATVIGAGKVTLAMMANMATARLLGRNTAEVGVPEVISDIPTDITIGSKYIYRAEGTDIPVTDGGTGASNVAGARKNLGIKGNLYYNIGRPRICNLALTDADLKGFQGGFTDGRYGYFVPYSFGKVARVDLNDFSTVSVLNLASTDADLKGFIGGFTDGRYGYFVPYNNGAYFGKVARLYMNFGGGL